MAIRNKKRLSVALLAVLFAVGAFTGVVVAQRDLPTHPFARPPFSMQPFLQHEGPFRGFLKELALTEEQQQQFVALHHERREQREQFLQLREAMVNLSLSADYTSAAADNLARQLGDLTATIAIERAQAAATFYQSLSAEQQEKFNQARTQHKFRGFRHFAQ
jgi:Spy/CpxP family protein refolding chaperone